MMRALSVQQQLQLQQLLLTSGRAADIATASTSVSVCTISNKSVLSLRPFSNSASRSFRASQPSSGNRVLDSIRTPDQFHTHLQSCSSSNTLLLLLFTTSACTPCRTISPLLQSLVLSRPPDQPLDRFNAIHFAELELDSPDTGGGGGGSGNMMEMGVEWGVTSVPTLMGLGGRRAERVTDRLTDTNRMSDKVRMQQWVDDVMRKGDPYATGASSGGTGGGSGSGGAGAMTGDGSSKSWWQRIFG